MLAKSNVLLIRHAEDPEVGPSPEQPQEKHDRGLSALGEVRAQSYAYYFSNLPLPDRRGKAAAPYDFLFAAKSTGHSRRPVLTLQPLATRLRRDIDDSFHAGDHKTAAEHAKLAKHLLRSPEFAGKNIIICWHHQHILCLAEWLLGDDADLPSDAPWPKAWPSCVYGWLLWISYDTKGMPTGRCYR